MDRSIHEHLQHYFGAPAGYYWRWADNGNVIEYAAGLTLCYRDELIALLQEMTPIGWPPLGSILWVLCACKNNNQFIAWADEQALFLTTFTQEDPEKADTFKTLLETVSHLFRIIAQLPDTYRTGRHRALLLNTLFSQVPPEVNAHEAAYLLPLFNEGIYKSSRSYAAQLEKELHYLAATVAHVPDATALEMQLRTGLTALPNAWPAALPEAAPLPESDFFTTLAADTATAGISRLATHLLAALNIPLHTQSSSGPSFGGISDITNKGNYDRLLLSELAQDEDILTARLSNNEAMYLRREQVPAEAKKRTVILIDITIRMWGLPRIFALSVALACQAQQKKDTNVYVYTLGGEQITPVDLRSVKGITAMLSLLDNHLHPAAALNTWWQQDTAADTAYYFITAAQQLQQPALQAAISDRHARLHYLLTVDRNGTFQYYDYSHGRNKLCNSAQVDLQELLFGTPEKMPQPVTSLPVILQQEVSPLRIPASRLKRAPDKNFFGRDTGVVCITTDLRVLYWPQRHKAAINLYHYLEPGIYHFGNRFFLLYLLVIDKNHPTVTIHEFNLDTYRHKKISTMIPYGDYQVAFDKDTFHLLGTNHRYSIWAATGATAPAGEESQVLTLAAKTQRMAQVKLNEVFRFVSNGYSTLSRITSIYISVGGDLIIEKRRLALYQDHHLTLTGKQEMYTHTDSNNDKSLPDSNALVIFPVKGATTTWTLPENPHITFTCFMWADGSKAIADSRGFLHLRSANTAIPEITLTMVIDNYLAAWASDGVVCGHDYFLHDHPPVSLPVPDFYNNYIRRFIQQLR
ncbi:hypothetical protein [Chitinophaga nivalis]|uniref:Uncharacterized protein n=1 Tax=Chitinophaga nivalis TaxID=2991709 RepID=A0ABT3IR88_9BACT|nr:hypothetical protein [Chitinophaga nivalis]MCW3463828.1 hypothetical protein [Chitinophaga nivalis]MCW3486482.1 hypothetical protein [Chitinophaga nivalis]